MRLAIDRAVLRQHRLDLVADAADHAGRCIQENRFDLALQAMGIIVRQLAILKADHV